MDAAQQLPEHVSSTTMRTGILTVCTQQSFEYNPHAHQCDSVVCSPGERLEPGERTGMRD